MWSYCYESPSMFLSMFLRALERDRQDKDKTVFCDINGLKPLMKIDTA